MHYFVAEMSQLDTGSVVGFIKQAEAIYNENLSAYVRIVLRRPFAKLIVRDPRTCSAGANTELTGIL